MLEHRRKRWDAALALAAALLVVGLWLLNEQPWRPTLVVWCCGSNQESQVAFASDFARRNHCKALVVGAPVQWLLELAARARKPDLIVGRAGPGWLWLQEQGLIARGPEFFAVDPYVIIVPPGNEGEVTSPRDLVKGLYVVGAPEAMRPKGKCVASLLEAIGEDLGEPTLPETYYLAMRKRVKCGRQLPIALKQGRVYAAITQRSATTLPEAQGLEVIPIEPTHMLHMRACRGTIAQAAAVLAGSRRQELAERYLEDLLSPDSRETLQRHGYYPLGTPEAEPFKPLMQVFVPRQAHPLQDQLARELMADGQWDLALRRWLKLLYVFGPSPFDAKACYQAGYCAWQLGLKTGAWHLWQRCVRDYPRRGLYEWGGPVFESGLKGHSPEDLDEKHWADKARQALAEMGGPPPAYGSDWPVGDIEDALVAYVPTPIRVIDADLPKGSRRNMAVAQDALLCGAYDQALTDYLKVYALNAPNDLQDQALFRAGQCAWLTGNRAAAVDLWEACKSIHTGDAWAELAGRMLYLVGLEGQVPEDKRIPPDAVRILASEISDTGLATAQALALNNAYWAFQARHFSGALQECLKVVHAFYAPPKAGQEQPGVITPDLRPHARYWAGIICCWLGHPDAAVCQWRTLARDYPSGEWPSKVQRALAQLQAYPGLTADQRRALQTALAQPLAKRPTTAALGSSAPPSSGMDDDLWAAQLSLADLVPDKGQAAVWHHIALEQFVCHDWKAALYSFLKVLTVVNTRDEKMNKWQDEALYFAGACLQRLGAADRAAARWQQLLDHYPDSPWAARAGAKLKVVQARAGGEVSSSD